MSKGNESLVEIVKFLVCYHSLPLYHINFTMLQGLYLKSKAELGSLIVVLFLLPGQIQFARKNLNSFASNLPLF